MVCPRCATENRAGRRFCVACAAPLAVACPACGAIADPGDRFCGECAAPMASSAAPIAPGLQAGVSAVAPIAERRLVSVLFADLVGFTPFAEERDAEDVRETLSRYFEVATEVVARYGGTVEKFIGDAVMACGARRPPVKTTPSGPCAPRWTSSTACACSAPACRPEPASSPARPRSRSARPTRVSSPATSSTRPRACSPWPRPAPSSSARRPCGPPAPRSTSRRPASRRSRARRRPFRPGARVRVAAQRGGQGRSDLPEPPFVGRDEELRLLKDLIPTTGRDRRTRLVSITGPGGIGKSRWRGSSRSTSTASARPSGGTAAGRRRTARGSPSGPLVRWSAAGAAWRRTPTRPPPASASGPRWPSSWPATRTADGWSQRCSRCSGSSPRRRAAATCCSPPGGSSSSASPLAAPPCCCSRTSSGRTPACSTSWTTCSSGRATCRCWSSRWPAPSCSTGGPAGARRCAT